MPKHTGYPRHLTLCLASLYRALHKICYYFFEVLHPKTYMQGHNTVRTIRVLLIDDDKNYYNLIQKMLARDKQYHLEWASNYEIARTLVTKTQHDVYLVDYRLDDVHTGLDLLHEFQALGINTPFIVMTSYADREFDLRVLEEGAADYIDKGDLKPGILMRTIRHAVQRVGDVKALRESEERYRTLLEDASDGILIVNGEGKITICNSTAATMTQHTHQTLVGRNILEMLHAPHNGAPSFNLQDISSETQIKELRIQRTDGSLLPVEISFKRTNEGSVQCILRDITRRMEIETEREKYIQRLTILRQIDEEINQMLNMEYVQSMALDAAVRLSGARAGFIGTFDNGRLRMVQAIGHYAQIAPGDILDPYPLFEEVISTQIAKYLPDMEQFPNYKPIRPDTRAQMVIPLMSYERILGLLNLESNRTDRFTEELFEFIKLIAARVAVAMENAQLYQIAQEQLNRMEELYRQVSELEQLKSDMIRIAAHDLRNPVGVIVGFIELLEWSLEGKLTDKQKTQFAAMMRAAQRMERITSDILSLERIEKLNVDRGKLMELNAVVKEAYEEYVGQATKKSQQISLEMPDEKLNIQADGAQIREAAANLIGNAIKYTPENGTVRVVVRQDNGHAVFEVIDTGFGIPAEQQASLFQPFFRASSDETANIEGTGLGLHLVKNIIKRYDGEMIFNSEYGKGSTFGFKMTVIK